MKLATTVGEGHNPDDKKLGGRNYLSTGGTADRKAVSQIFSAPALDGAPVDKYSGRTRTISAKVGESLFIVEYDGSVPLNVPDDWPLPSYEVRRKLPMKECNVCHSDIFRRENQHLGRRARRTSWVFRKKGEFFWLRVCFAHMKPEQRAVIKEMYSR